MYILVTSDLTIELSYHYFHSYACLDRIDLSGLSDSSPLGVINVTQACLTTDDELITIMSHLEVLVSRFSYDVIIGVTRKRGSRISGSRNTDHDFDTESHAIIIIL